VVGESDWGFLIADANFRQNSTLKRTPALDTKTVRDILTEEGEIFGAFLHYRLLKQCMLSTLEHGMNSLGHKESEVIRSEVCYKSPNERIC
jgi:hypothetical protein